MEAGDIAQWHNACLGSMKFPSLTPGTPSPSKKPNALDTLTGTKSGSYYIVKLQKQNFKKKYSYCKNRILKKNSKDNSANVSPALQDMDLPQCNVRHCLNPQ